MKIKKGFAIPFLSIIICVWIIACSNNVEQPNILFILSDDHAVNAIGCYNKRLSDEVRTPNIEQLAVKEYPPAAPEWELYDLEDDLEEMINIYNYTEQQNLIKELKNQILDLKKQYDYLDEK